MLNEATISKAIIDEYNQKLSELLELDVAIVGGGPSGLVAGYYIAKAGKKVALLDQKLSIGGGIWGGGMMFNVVVVQEEGKAVLDEMSLKAKPYKHDYYTVDSVYLASSLVHKATEAGLRIFNLISVEDVVIHNERVTGVVINWSAVAALKWHIDPLAVHARCVLDATGHDANIAEILTRKMGVRLATATGAIVGEKSMDADYGESQTVENSIEVYPGLFVSGMAANTVCGGYRMGPVFGGMLLSGRKVAQDILKVL